MTNPRRPLSLKLIKRLLYTKSTSLNQVACNQKSRPVEPVMAMHPNHRTGKTAVVVALLHLVRDFELETVDQRNEIPGLVGRGWDLGYRWVFVVMDSAFFQRGWVVDWVLVADVDNSIDAAVLVLCEFDRIVLLVDFAEHFQRHECVCHALRHR